MIYWVFGGTAVGKKLFIQRCLDKETRPAFMGNTKPMRAVWVADGPLDCDLVALNVECDLLVRWQWGREEELQRILREKPNVVEHKIIMLTCTLMTQLSRVALREGCLKWDAEILHGELRGVYECVHRVAGSRVPVLFVDSSVDYVQRV